MAPMVSVVVVVHNERDYIEDCIESILNQSYGNFELIIVDDFSDDGTTDIIKRFKDKRIKTLFNDRNLGIAKSRNVGIENASGEYIFFTDGDCTPARNWLEEGLRVLKKKDILAVEGKTLYEIKKTIPTFVDKINRTLDGGCYGTANMGYKREVILRVGGFNPEHNRGADIDLGYRILKKGRIGFCKDMIVIHRHKKYTYRSLMELANRVEDTLRLYMKYTESEKRRCRHLGRIVIATHLLYLFFPPLIFITYAFRSFEDFKLLPVFYLYLVIERINIWKFAYRNRVFLI